jgi:hypothetical protein
MVNNIPQSRIQIFTQALSDARSKFENIEKRLNNAVIESMHYENSNAENLSPLYDEYHTALEAYGAATNELARALNEMSEQQTNSNSNSNANSNNNPNSPLSNSNSNNNNNNPNSPLSNSNSNNNNNNPHTAPAAGGKRRNKKARISRKSRKSRKSKKSRRSRK